MALGICIHLLQCLNQPPSQASISRKPSPAGKRPQYTVPPPFQDSALGKHLYNMYNPAGKPNQASDICYLSSAMFFIQYSPLFRRAFRLTVENLSTIELKEGKALGDIRPGYPALASGDFQLDKDSFKARVTAINQEYAELGQAMKPLDNELETMAFIDRVKFYAVAEKWVLTNQMTGDTKDKKRSWIKNTKDVNAVIPPVIDETTIASQGDYGDTTQLLADMFKTFTRVAEYKKKQTDEKKRTLEDQKILDLYDRMRFEVRKNITHTPKAGKGPVTRSETVDHSIEYVGCVLRSVAELPEDMVDPIAEVINSKATIESASRETRKGNSGTTETILTWNRPDAFMFSCEVQDLSLYQVPVQMTLDPIAVEIMGGEQYYIMAFTQNTGAHYVCYGRSFDNRCFYLHDDKSWTDGGNSTPWLPTVYKNEGLVGIRSISLQKVGVKSYPLRAIPDALTNQWKSQLTQNQAHLLQLRDRIVLYKERRQHYTATMKRPFCFHVNFPDASFFTSSVLCITYSSVLRNLLHYCAKHMMPVEDAAVAQTTADKDAWLRVPASLRDANRRDAIQEHINDLEFHVQMNAFLAISEAICQSLAGPSDPQMLPADWAKLNTTLAKHFSTMPRSLFTTNPQGFLEPLLGLIQHMRMDDEDGKRMQLQINSRPKAQPQTPVPAVTKPLYLQFLTEMPARLPPSLFVDTCVSDQPETWECPNLDAVVLLHGKPDTTYATTLVLTTETFPLMTYYTFDARVVAVITQEERRGAGNTPSYGCYGLSLGNPEHGFWYHSPFSNTAIPEFKGNKVDVDRVVCIVLQRANLKFKGGTPAEILHELLPTVTRSVQHAEILRKNKEQVRSK